MTTPQLYDKVDTMAGGRPTKYKKEYSEQAGELCRMGAIDEDLARFFKVSKQTINTWKQKHPEFLDSLNQAKSEADARVERALYETATGYRHIVKKPMVVSDGQGAGSHVEVVEYEERIAPNTTSMIFWLKNRRPAQWRDKQEVEHSGSVQIVDDIG